VFFLQKQQQKIAEKCMLKGKVEMIIFLWYDDWKIEEMEY